LFGPDAASFQGDVNWGAVDASMAFGWEKTTQGTGYVNPRWAAEQPEMAARARASGFIPGAYLFLEAGDGAAQATFFHAAAGSLDGFALAVDIEPTAGSSPTMATARACVTRLRALYPGKPITGYIPRWYWGSQDTTFVDVLWASDYVTPGPAPAPVLYGHVTPGQWAGYGGRAVDLLQFTDKAIVAGVAGPCDCSAYRGSVAQLRALLLGGPAAGPISPAQEADSMQPGLICKGEGAVTPVALIEAHNRILLFSNRAATVRADWVGTGDPSAEVTLGYGKGRQTISIPARAHAVVLHRVDAGDNDVSMLVVT
jgi:GH25 family lysozyme M1 (1,4-beta-N-acetylmuramidase)